MKKQPTIGIDARTIFDGHRRGIGKTLLILYKHLLQVKPDWRFVFFHQKQAVDNPFEGCENVIVRQIDIRGDRWNFWQNIRLPLAALREGVDVLHCPANTAPRWPGVPMVLTIHDLIPLQNEFATSDSKVWRKLVKRSARKARKIVTPSVFSQQEIVQNFGIKTDKVIVNSWACAIDVQRNFDSAELRRALAKYGIEPDTEYVFGFAAADPRKNTERILLAWKKLQQNLSRRCVLLLVGIQEQALEAFVKRCDELELTQSVILKGFVDEVDLPALLNGAQLLCYPSLSEGFGLPVLDAMACGTAVLTSTATSLPEIAGGAAVLVDPYCSDAIAEGMDKILNNKELQRKLERLGRENALRFTWRGCAERMGKVFDGVLEESC